MCPKLGIGGHLLGVAGVVSFIITHRWLLREVLAGMAIGTTPVSAFRRCHNGRMAKGLYFKLALAPPPRSSRAGRAEGGPGVLLETLYDAATFISLTRPWR